MAPFDGSAWEEEDDEAVPPPPAEVPYYNNFPDKQPPPGGLIDMRTRPGATLVGMNGLEGGQNLLISKFPTGLFKLCSLLTFLLVHFQVAILETVLNVSCYPKGTDLPHIIFV